MLEYKFPYNYYICYTYIISTFRLESILALPTDVTKLTRRFFHSPVFSLIIYSSSSRANSANQGVSGADLGINETQCELPPTQLRSENFALLALEITCNEK